MIKIKTKYRKIFIDKTFLSNSKEKIIIIFVCLLQSSDLVIVCLVQLQNSMVWHGLKNIKDYRTVRLYSLFPVVVERPKWETQKLLIYKLCSCKDEMPKCQNGRIYRFLSKKKVQHQRLLYVITYECVNVRFVFYNFAFHPHALIGITLAITGTWQSYWTFMSD